MHRSPVLRHAPLLRPSLRQHHYAGHISVHIQYPQRILPVLVYHSETVKITQPYIIRPSGRRPVFKRYTSILVARRLNIFRRQLFLRQHTSARRRHSAAQYRHTVLLRNIHIIFRRIPRVFIRHIGLETDRCHRRSIIQLIMVTLYQLSHRPVEIHYKLTRLLRTHRKRPRSLRLHLRRLRHSARLSRIDPAACVSAARKHHLYIMLPLDIGRHLSLCRHLSVN